MARSSASVAQRNLTLTEELEKLEQSITLTLQEIDHNFSRAHRIVTSSILPVVEEYAKHSQTVWEGSKFWKQFFEASANVSLNGYEETPAEDETITATEEDTEGVTASSSYGSPPQQHGQEYTPASTRYGAGDSEESSSFPSPDFSTPRPPPRGAQPSIATYNSPYETLRREIQSQGADEDEPASDLPSTPRAQTLSEATPESSPFHPPSTARQKTPAHDVLLHRVLDKNYRIQATPHSQPRLPKSGAPGNQTKTPMTGRRGITRTLDLDSSPLEEAPQLNSEMFRSPAKAPRVPGVSVLTPGKAGTAAKALQDNGNTTKTRPGAAAWDSDSDDEDLFEGMSPPKTIQFHVPQSKLLKTPAREASKQIVEDLLYSAGANMTGDYEDEDSPSVVKKGGLLEEDTF